MSAGRCGWFHQPGILPGHSFPSTAPVRKCEHPVCISLANAAGAAYSSCLHRQLVPFFFIFFFLMLSFLGASTLKAAPKYCQSKTPALQSIFCTPMQEYRRFNWLTLPDCYFQRADTCGESSLNSGRKSLKPLLSLDTLGWRRVVC